jgi:hypothetical protein
VTLLLLDAMASVSNLRFTDQDDGGIQGIGPGQQIWIFHDIS